MHVCGHVYMHTCIPCNLCVRACVRAHARCRSMCMCMYVYDGCMHACVYVQEGKGAKAKTKSARCVRTCCPLRTRERPDELS